MSISSRSVSAVRGFSCLKLPRLQLLKLSFSLMFLTVGVHAVSVQSVSAQSVPEQSVSAQSLEQAALPESSAAIAQLNQQFATAVVLPTYQQLNQHAATLTRHSEAFFQTPTEENLSAVRAASLELSRSWAKSGAFAFGPVHSLGFSANLEFPTDHAAIEVLVSDDTLTLEELQNSALHPSLQGLEAVDYVLADKRADEFSAQERTYLQYLATSAYQVTSELLAVWQEGWGDYAPYSQALATAGDAGNVFYLSAESASEEIVRTLINSLDVVTQEVLPEKLADPAALADDEISLTLLASHLEGIQLAYLGRDAQKSAMQTTVSFDGVSGLVARSNQSADQQIQQAFLTATEQLDNVIADPSDIDALAQTLTALTTVQESLEQDALPLVQSR